MLSEPICYKNKLGHKHHQLRIVCMSQKPISSCSVYGGQAKLSFSRQPWKQDGKLSKLWPTLKLSDMELYLKQKNKQYKSILTDHIMKYIYDYMYLQITKTC